MLTLTTVTGETLTLDNVVEIRVWFDRETVIVETDSRRLIFDQKDIKELSYCKGETK